MVVPALPCSLRWLFPELDFSSLQVARDRHVILTRVLERGRLVDVKWAMQVYGDEGILEFFRNAGSPELSQRTLGFWRAYFRAEDEIWKAPVPWRRNNSVRWVS